MIRTNKKDWKKDFFHCFLDLRQNKGHIPSLLKFFLFGIGFRKKVVTLQPTILRQHIHIYYIVMEQKTNKYITASYKLYDVTNGDIRLLEQTTGDRPFTFISGMGVVLPSFEEKIADLSEGETFEFVLKPEEAYGERHDERIVEINREAFCINGHFDHDNVFEGAVIPLQNEDGNRFYGKVLSITEESVKIDLNHQLAGLTLRFEGEILETREATNEEIAHLAKLLSGECGCDCDSCDGHHEHGEDGCDCGHHHHEHGEDCCGHHHGDGCCHHHDEEELGN